MDKEINGYASSGGISYLGSQPTIPLQRGCSEERGGRYMIIISHICGWTSDMDGVPVYMDCCHPPLVCRAT